MSARCRNASDHLSTKNRIPDESNNVISSYGGKKSNYDQRYEDLDWERLKQRTPNTTMYLLQKSSMFLLTGPHENSSPSFPSQCSDLMETMGITMQIGLLNLALLCWLSGCSRAQLAWKVFSDGLLFPHISSLTSLAITAPGPATTTWPGQMTVHLRPAYFPRLQITVCF